MSFSTNSRSRLVLALSFAGIVAACGKKSSSPAPAPVAPVAPVAPLVQTAGPTGSSTVPPAAQAPGAVVTLAPATVIIDAADLQKSPMATTVYFAATSLPSGVTASGVTYECKLSPATDFSACTGKDSFTFSNLENDARYTLAVRGTIASTKTLLTEASTTFTAHVSAANDNGTAGNDSGTATGDAATSDAATSDADTTTPATPSSGAADAENRDDPRSSDDASGSDEDNRGNMGPGGPSGPVFPGGGNMGPGGPSGPGSPDRHCFVRRGHRHCRR